MTDKQLDKFATLLRVIAHPVRLRILRILGEDGPKTVTELCNFAKCEQSLTSHHLRHLKDKGVLTAKRSGREIRYSLRETELLKLFDCLENCKCSFPQ